jgi:carbon storage regulator CsrA
VAALHFATRKKTFRNVLALKNGARQNGRRRIDNFPVSHDVQGPIAKRRSVSPLYGRSGSSPAGVGFPGKTSTVLLSGSLAVIQKSRGGEMQMITRRVNEGLVIENDIHVTVLDICQDYVRIAISSPNNTPPYREETLYWEEAEEEPAPELLLQ